MATTYPQQGGYQQASGGQPVATQVVLLQKSFSNNILKFQVCGCFAGTGLAICIGVVAGIILSMGSIFLGLDEMTTGIVLVAIGGILLIGSCFACAHFGKGMQNKGRVYNPPQVAVAGQPLISPAVPQPPPGAGYPRPQHQPPPGAGYPVPLMQSSLGRVYPGPQPPSDAVYPGQHQQQQYPMPPPAYSQPGPVPQPSYGPAYNPGQIGGTIPEQPAPQYASKAGEAAASAPMPPTDQTSEYERPPAYTP